MINQPHEAGRFGELYSDRTFLDAVRSHQPAGTSEVAGAVGCSRQNVDYRLRQLQADGTVTSKKTGASLAWHLESRAIE